MTRAELVQLVVDKLIANGTAPEVAKLTARPTFFVSGDAGLIELAIKLRVIGTGDTIDG